MGHSRVGSTQNQALQAPHLQGGGGGGGGGLFETTLMRSLIKVTKSGEYSRERGGQISMKKGQQGQVGLRYRLRERLLTTRHGENR